MAITEQEAWTERATSPVRSATCRAYIREVVEQIAFLAREDKKIDKRSGVSQRLPISVLENVVSNAERRALRNGENRGRAARARRLRRAAVDHRQDRTGIRRRTEGRRRRGARTDPRGRGQVSSRSIFEGVNLNSIVQWFDLGGNVEAGRDRRHPATWSRQLGADSGPDGKDRGAGRWARASPDAVRAGAAEFILEGLYAQRRISRSEERGFTAEQKPRDAAAERRERDKRERELNSDAAIKRDFQ